MFEGQAVIEVWLQTSPSGNDDTCQQSKAA